MLNQIILSDVKERTFSIGDIVVIPDSSTGDTQETSRIFLIATLNAPISSSFVVCPKFVFTIDLRTGQVDIIQKNLKDLTLAVVRRYSGDFKIVTDYDISLPSPVINTEEGL